MDGDDRVFGLDWNERFLPGRNLISILFLPAVVETFPAIFFYTGIILGSFDKDRTGSLNFSISTLAFEFRPDGA